MKKILRKTKKALGICRSLFKNFFVDQTNTLCPFLWSQVYIDNKGDIFSCCFCAPWAVGNIYKHDLQCVWRKSFRLKIARWLSLAGSLHCFTNCFMSHFNTRTMSTSGNASLRYPKTIALLYGTFCNIHCVMCCQDHGSKIMLDNQVLQKNIDWAQVEDVVLLGGEVLAMSNAKEFYLWLTDTQNKKVNIMTNGLLIDDFWAERLVRGSRWIYISVNAATAQTYRRVCNQDFSRVIEAIQKLIVMKKKYNADVKIQFSFCIVPENMHELCDAIMFAEKLGCDIISFCVDSRASSIVKQNADLREGLKIRVSRLVDEKGKSINIQTEQLVALGLVSQ